MDGSQQKLFTNSGTMTTWIATHGIGAIKDSASSFSIAAEAGCGTVKPTNKDERSGWIHFTIQSPPPGYPFLKGVEVDFSSQSATVEKVEVYMGNDLVFGRDLLQETGSFHRAFDAQASSIRYTSKIAVSVYVEFEVDDEHAKIRFQSVGLQI